MEFLLENFGQDNGFFRVFFTPAAVGSLTCTILYHTRPLFVCEFSVGGGQGVGGVSSEELGTESTTLRL